MMRKSDCCFFVSNKVDRRRVLSLAAGAFVMTGSGLAWADSADEFAAKLQEIVSSPELEAGLRLKDDLEFFEKVPTEERAPIRTPKSSTKISAKASDLIVACEVSGKAAYQNAYYRPTWPKGSSGVTIGIGYDVGYVTPGELASDWVGILNSSDMALLSEACGLTGSRAAAILAKMRSVSVGWDDALKEYFDETQPRYVGLTEASLPNTALLSPDSLGALVSLVYNRGASFGVSEANDPSGRFREMRNVKSHMAAKTFDQIPGELLAMRRLWLGVQDMRGVVLRREAEAALFTQGLAKKSG